MIKETRYTIELDCPPGNPRPDDLLPGVLEGTGLTIDPKATVSRVFGNWTWEIPKEQEAIFLAARDTIAARIKALYNRGIIRYGSW